MAFETRGSRKRGLRRARPPRPAGHPGRPRRHELLVRAAASASPEIRNRGRMRSRFSRCSTSSLRNAARPARTSSSAGWYSLRQASAKAPQSSLCPAAPRMLSASRATPVRKSTNVPNTSKNSALTLIAGLPSGRSCRLPALRFEHLGGGGAGERLEQGLGGVALLALGAESGGIDGVVLNLRRQWTHERDAFHRQDFADLVNAELRLALGHVLRHRAARDQFGLG